MAATSNMVETVVGTTAWRLADLKMLPDLLRFLRKEEWGNVAFSARLLRHRQPTLPSRLQESIYLHLDGDQMVSAALLQTLFGLYMPVFGRDTGLDTLNMLAGALKARRFQFHRLHSVIGRSRSARMLRALLRRPAGTTVPYWIMSLERLPSVPTSGGLRLRRARPDDLHQLMPLHERYMFEEVLLNRRDYDRIGTLRLLRRALRTQLIYVAEWQGRIVAKAGTNARGMIYDQIGGVFTAEQQRNRGIAAALLQGLANHIMVDGRKLCLFVKHSNAAALSLYTKLGFEIRDEFEISYY